MKKAQITLFIIIGIVIVAVLGTTIYIVSTISEQRLERAREKTTEQARGGNVPQDQQQPPVGQPVQQQQSTTTKISSPSQSQPPAATTSSTQPQASAQQSPAQQPPSTSPTTTPVSSPPQSQSQPEQPHAPPKPTACKDGTPPNTCSTGRPSFCKSDFTTNPDCRRCGCPESMACAPENTCKNIEYQFIYVPLGNWPSQELFEEKAEERALFFQDISPLKESGIKNHYIPTTFADTQCDLVFTDWQDANNHKKVKACADRYASAQGISYERGVGLAYAYEGGYAYLGNKVGIATLGYASQDRQGIVAHELGHTYLLCDEYNYQSYVQEGGTKCPNKWPKDCDTTTTKCPGNAPIYRSYSGPSLSGVCKGKQYLSVMGWSVSSECGYDQTGGYEQMEKGLR